MRTFIFALVIAHFDQSIVPASLTSISVYLSVVSFLPLNHHSDWASLVAHLVKNLHAMPEIWVRSLGWEDPLDKGTVTYSSLENSINCIVHGVAKNWTRLSDFH